MIFIDFELHPGSKPSRSFQATERHWKMLEKKTWENDGKNIRNCGNMSENGVSQSAGKSNQTQMVAFPARHRSRALPISELRWDYPKLALLQVIADHMNPGDRTCALKMFEKDSI